MRLTSRPRGFTMAEVVVTAIVALVLTAIAVPQLTVGATAGTDETAQSSVASAASAELTYYQSSQAFTTSSSQLAAIDPSITYVASPAVSPVDTTVSVAQSSGGNEIGLASLGANGTCWMMRRSTDPASTYDGPVLYASGSSTTTTTYPCTGAAALLMNSDSTKFVSANTGLSWSDPLLLP